MEYGISIYFSYILRPPLEGRALQGAQTLWAMVWESSRHGNMDRGRVERGIERELYFTEPPDFHIFPRYPPL